MGRPTWFFTRNYQPTTDHASHQTITSKTHQLTNAMYTEAKIEKFLELRARGWSLGHLATELDVSKR